MGLFRLAASTADVYKFEINMAAGNYSHITEVKNPHVVSNYLKRLLREMKDPLIPFHQYTAYGELKDLEEEDKIMRIKQLIRETDELRQETLKLLINFFRDVVAKESINKMTSYNIAVTTCPCIFRPK